MSATDISTENVIVSCSFCGKPHTNVEKLVAGPGVFICNECVELSATIIADTADMTAEESARQRARFFEPSTEDILAMLPALARSATRLEAELARRIGSLREHGIDWQQIANTLDMSVAEVRRRFEATPEA